MPASAHRLQKIEQETTIDASITLTSVIDARSHDDSDSIHYILEFYGPQVQAHGINHRHVCRNVLGKRANYQVEVKVCNV